MAKNSQEVLCRFTSQFDRPIDVTTNLRMYSHLSELAQRFSRADNKSNSNKLQAVTVPQRTYKAEKVVLEPKISVLGEATPSVSRVLGWLGFEDRNSVCTTRYWGPLTGGRL